MAHRSRIFTLVCAVVALAGCGSSSSNPHSSATATSATTASSAPTTPGPEVIPLEPGPALAPASTTAAGNPVDGIQCAPEQLAYHIHAHLQVYVNGSPRALPGGIGIVGAISEQTANGPFFGAQVCYYWLHTHASDGVIHIESPTEHIYVLGNFFDLWNQPLSSTRVADAAGKVTAVVNGKPWTHSPRLIPLTPHVVIELSVGSPVAPYQSVDWSRSQL
jgi:hypothetical protein